MTSSPDDTEQVVSQVTDGLVRLDRQKKRWRRWRRRLLILAFGLLLLAAAAFGYWVFTHGLVLPPWPHFLRSWLPWIPARLGFALQPAA